MLCFPAFGFYLPVFIYDIIQAKDYFLLIPAGIGLIRFCPAFLSSAFILVLLMMLSAILSYAFGRISDYKEKLHHILKTGTSDSRKDWFAVGEYKRLPNEVGGMQTSLPEEVADRMKALLSDYNAVPKKTLDDILDFHVRFERIHPFQDGNGRVGRLIMFKECLKYNIVPFIIEENLKLFYYRGLKEWYNEKGYLTDTCLTAQDKYKAYLDYFRIPYEK